MFYLILWIVSFAFVFSLSVKLEEPVNKLLTELKNVEQYEIVFPILVSNYNRRTSDFRLERRFRHKREPIFHKEEFSKENLFKIIKIKNFILDIKVNEEILVSKNVDTVWIGKNNIEKPDKSFSDYMIYNCSNHIGLIRGQTESSVTITICEDKKFLGIIHTKNKVYYIQPTLESKLSMVGHLMYAVKSTNLLKLDNDQLKTTPADHNDKIVKNEDNFISNKSSRDVNNLGNNIKNISDTTYQKFENKSCKMNKSRCVKTISKTLKEPRHKRESYRNPYFPKVISTDSINNIGLNIHKNSEIKYHRFKTKGNERNVIPVVYSNRTLANENSRPVLHEDLKKMVDEDDVGYFIDALYKNEILQEFRKDEFITSPPPPRWLELAVAVDYSVISFHGKTRVQQYILALMNIVSAIYRDPSLNSNLRLIIVRIVFHESESDNLVIEGNSKKSLENVNRWNKKLLSTLSIEKRHDVAVWLTRKDLGGPSGYAPVSGACDPARSCTLNKDEGLTSAFIIAHEVAHVLGLTHDGDKAARNDCGQEALQGSVMAPMVSATFHRFSWSTCSKMEFHEKALKWPCLTNQPTLEQESHLKSKFQETFTMDEQCRMEFGEGYSLCHGEELPEPCSHLWCGHSSTPDLCITKKGPPLEGTECRVGYWCVNGFCEMVDQERFGLEPVVHNPRNGNWSEWSDWGTCTRSCGYGVSFRTRTCDNPRPAYGGANCLGKSEEFKICGKQPCPDPLRDTKAEQCSKLKNILPQHGWLNDTWLPYEPHQESYKCQLSCISLRRNEVLFTGENVIDGTPCTYEHSSNICIQGECEMMGCDGNLSSVVTEDSCGVCGGNNSECSNITTEFTKNIRKGT